jgi:hypothetical protein
MYLAGAIIARLIGIGCLIGAIVAFVKQRRQRGEAVTTTGVVTGLTKRVMNPGSAAVYCPTVEFTALSGERISFESAFGSMPAAYQVGQAVKIYYDPKNPAKAEVDSGLSRWLTPGCLLALQSAGVSSASCS